MRRPSRRTLAALAALAVIGAVAAGAAVAASSGDPDPAAERQAYLNDVAKRLGVETSKLEDALKGAALARVDAALARGAITQDEANALKSRIEAGKLGPGFGPRFGRHHMRGPGFLTGAAEYLGLTQAELRTELRAGKSLAQIARDKGKSVDGLKQAILKAARTKLDAAVADGRLTAAQRDEMIARLKEQIDSLVEGTLPARPHGFGPRPGAGPGAFHGPPRFDRPSLFDGAPLVEPAVDAAGIY